MKSPTIEFVNHASVIISYNEISILSDPWYKGTIFNNGWRLIHEPEDTKIYDIIKKITHIYISHEHPDHFSPAFFLDPNVKDILIKKKIEILFQNTEDKRVINFLKREGFSTNEISSNKNRKLNKDIEIKIIKHDFYDSSLIIKTPDLKILNLNDCPLRSKNEINKFKKKHGDFDILLTQFSYAAWKGGVKNKIYRKKAAEEKLEAIEKQANILNCKSIIPFASFIYFSNELNHYMNDSINTPEALTNFFSSNKNNIVILSPGEIQNLKHLKQNQSSLEFWKKEYTNIKLKKKDKFNSTIKLEELSKQFSIYQEKIFKKNSKFLIYILNRIKIMNFFQTLKIKLIDHNKIYLYSIFDGLTETFDNTQCDIEMHSESLFFIFKNEFGFDTLTVNGCFDASRLGFAKTTKSLAIGSLNSMGLHFNLSLIFNIKIILLFLGKLKNVLNKIT